ncbi:MAG: T9SS type A sorting domain-containing protein [Saprospirales bacterium]|nr:T9SS type A sorting domain-containing protein [Saprospirales bacterium]
MYFYENSGLGTSACPALNTVGLSNQFGFIDQVGDDLRCDWIITRIVDFLDTGCPMAVSYNPCNNELYYYPQDPNCCDCPNLPVSVEQVSETVNFVAIHLYPNPAQNQLYINIPDMRQEGTIEVSDMQGKVLTQIPVAAFQSEMVLPVGHFPPAFYLLLLKGKNKEVLAVEKWVKQ